MAEAAQERWCWTLLQMKASHGQKNRTNESPSAITHTGFLMHVWFDFYLWSIYFIFLDYEIAQNTVLNYLHCRNFW